MNTNTIQQGLINTLSKKAGKMTDKQKRYYKNVCIEYMEQCKTCENERLRDMYMQYSKLFKVLSL